MTSHDETNQMRKKSIGIERRKISLMMIIVINVVMKREVVEGTNRRRNCDKAMLYAKVCQRYAPLQLSETDSQVFVWNNVETCFS